MDGWCGFCLLDFLANSQRVHASKGPDVRLSRMAGAGQNGDDMVAQRVDQDIGKAHVK